MPVCAGPLYPSAAYYSLDGPPAYGFMAHHINEIKKQVYSELKAQRARSSVAQKSYHSSYGHRPQYTDRHCSPPPKRTSLSSGSSATRFAFPTPQIPSLGTGLPPVFPSLRVLMEPHIYSPKPAVVPSMQPEHRVRFPSPHPYGPDTPISSNSLPLPIPVPPLDAPMNSIPLYTHQGQPKVVPFPDTDESTALLPLPTPSVFGSSTASTRGHSSSRSSSSSLSYGSSRSGRINYNELRKASENMLVIKEVTSGWIDIIRRYRAEKPNTEETDVNSLIKSINQRASSALNKINVILANEGSHYSTHITSGKMALDVSALATLGTSLQQKLASLVRRLKDAKVTGCSRPPGCFERVMNAPGCLAGWYLKHRLLRFTSLMKAQRDQYSDLDAQVSLPLGSDRMPMSKFLGSLYYEVRRTYGTISAALAGFERSIHAFQIEFQTETMGSHHAPSFALS